MTAAMALHVALSMRLDAIEAYRLAHAYRDEVTRRNAALIEDRACDADFTASRDYCAGLREGAELLNRAATGETTSPADFFQPGRTYTKDAPFRAPEDRPNFQCIAVAIHPTTGSRRALGFEQAGAGGPWKSASFRDEEWADGWADITDTTQGDRK